MENNKKQLSLLINNKEIAHFLLSLIDYKKELENSGIIFHPHETEQFIQTLNTKMLEPKNRQKLREKIEKNIRIDMKRYLFNVESSLEQLREKYFNTVHIKIEDVIDSLGIDTIFDLYKKSDYDHFVKSTGLNLDPNATFVRRKHFNSYKADCLIRNTVGNEDLLVTKIDKNYPFWFIDSGYTNFLEPNKKWHRLVRNHLHYGNYFDAPCDRLGNFKTFPKQWRQDGDMILIIEPGPFAAGVFHVDLKTWKYDIEKELRQYTDKKIVFREKAPKTERTRLYDELLNEDYYCIVNINSNAATEAIWAGIPAITLDKHITNPVTVNKLSDINNLYRGKLADWLCMLSYSQFTKEELMNGTAHNMVKKYNV